MVMKKSAINFKKTAAIISVLAMSLNMFACAKTSTDEQITETKEIIIPDITEGNEIVTEANVIETEEEKSYANYLFTNADILTEDENNAHATVLAIKDGKIVYVGNEVKDVLINKDTEVIDLEGKFITPNLIDAHTHPATVAMTKWCTYLDGETKEELIQQIRDACKTKDPKKEPYIFFKSYPSDLFGEDGPRKEWLDEIEEAEGFAIAISDWNDHSVWVNSKWLEVYGAYKRDESDNLVINDSIDEKKIVGFKRDEDTGDYTGLIEELFWTDYMEDFYDTLGWKPPIEQTEELMSIVTDDLKKWGVTGVFDAYIESDQQMISVSNLDKSDKLNMYYDLSVKMPTFDDLEPTIERIKRLNDAYSTEHVKIDTIKIFYDGTNESGTSALVDGLSNGDETYNADEHILLSEDETYEVIKRANEEGLDVQFHMVGDLAFRRACDATERLINEVGELTSQVEFCHCEYINPEDYDRPAKLGIIVNWTPHWSGGYFGESALTYLGKERYNAMYQFNPLIESGAIVTFGSDIYSWDEEQRANPYFGMETAMTRIDLEYPLEDADGNEKMRESEDAKLSLEDLMKGYTINAAKALRIDDVTGSIEVGKSANFNIYERSLFEIHTNELRDVLPEAVYFEGKKIAGD